MFTHVVLLKPKDKIAQAKIVAVLEHLKTIQKVITGIVSVKVGENLRGPNSQGYTYGMVIQFANRESFNDYVPHPAHRAVGEEMQPIFQSVIGLDIVSL